MKRAREAHFLRYVSFVRDEFEPKAVHARFNDDESFREDSKGNCESHFYEHSVELRGTFVIY